MTEIGADGSFPPVAFVVCSDSLSSGSTDELMLGAAEAIERGERAPGDVPYATDLTMVGRHDSAAPVPQFLYGLWLFDPAADGRPTGRPIAYEPFCVFRMRRMIEQWSAGRFTAAERSGYPDFTVGVHNHADGVGMTVQFPPLPRKEAF